MTTLGLAMLLAASPGHEGAIMWTRDVRAGMEEARVTARPIMMFFSADW